jgi:CO/xanthine dehydrogenase FAD-binding subunit
VIRLINTRIVAQEFEYFLPKTLQEASDLLRQYGAEAKLIAGGTDVVILLKQEKISPTCLINIMNIPELRYIREDEGLRIGAATTLHEVRRYCSQSGYSALYEAISVLAKPQVWNMGTIGGNICNASPAADTAPPLLALNGRVKLMSERGERIVDLEDFFTAVNQTTMGPDEIMLEIQADPIEAGMGTAFLKTARVGADISKVTCAVSLKREEASCASCRIAMGAVAPVPMRVKAAEGMIQGQKVDASLIERVGKKVSEEIRPIDDVRSTAEYRRDLAGVMFKDVFWKAWHRAGGEEN